LQLGPDPLNFGLERIDPLLLVFSLVCALLNGEYFRNLD